MLHLVTRGADQDKMPPIVRDWHRFGEIGIAFAEAIVESRLTYTSMCKKADDLDLFLTWLPTQFSGQPPTMLSLIATERLLTYRAHLDMAKSPNGKPYSPQTKRLRLGNVRTVFKWLQRPSGKWNSRLAPKLRFPDGVWLATARRSVPHPVVSEDQLRAILMACASEIEMTMARHEEGLRLLGEGRRHLSTGFDKANDFRELSVVLAAVESLFEGAAPTLETIKAEHGALGAAIKNVHRMSTVSSFLYPSFRTLIPFVVLLTIHTAYNPDTVRGLRLGQIVTNDVFTDQFRLDQPERTNSRARDEEPSLVPERLRTNGWKGRAKRGRLQHRSFRVNPDEAFGAYMTIEHVKALTTRLRAMAPAAICDKLFLFRMESGGGTVGTFGRDAKKALAGDALWQHGLGLFTAENNLPKFTLVNIRATMAEAAERLTGDLRAVQLLLGHAGWGVTFNHYFTAAGRARGSESVAAVQSKRQRWVETGGKRDVREECQGDSLMSATPGMDCMDPYDSPMPGQVKGKMCSAWLACFFCPLAAVRVDDGYSFARLVQLESNVAAAGAAGAIAPERYQATYLPVLRKIPEWLERFTPAARKAAADITYLKPLPELE